MVIKYMIDKTMLIFSTIKPIGAILITITAFLAPIASIIHGVFILIGLDLVTGIAASIKKGKFKLHILYIFKAHFWRHITSSGLGRTIQKTLVYMILIISGFVIDTLILPGIGTLIVTKILAGATALRELKSLVENTELILGGGIITFIKAVAKNGFAGALKTLGEEDKPKQ